MTVDIKFDASQQYQLDAIGAVVDLFDGQEVVEQGVALPGAESGAAQIPGMADLVFGNTLELSGETLRRNLRAVQDGPSSTDEADDVRPRIPESLRTPVDDGTAPLDFSVEMETGTGKTYVYLRTIAELNRKYGFRKFLIVVPSVAIREGVLSSLDLLKPHIRELYDGLQFDHYVYDSSALTRVRQFATTPHLQIMVINIDSFTKETNIINRSTDSMNGHAPIEFIQACRPIVVMDEPQNMETTIRREAIASLQSLFKLRYSATHRDLQHLVYRLTPVDAYDLRLVKRIEVLSITQDVDLSLPHVEITRVTATPADVTATARIHRETGQGTKPTQVTLRKDDDLEELSGGRVVYRGWIVEDIVAPVDGRPGYVEFGNHRILREGSSTGENRDQLQRIQIRQAIESHFEAELDLFVKERRGIIQRTKPLTLFFVDKVANYYPEDGKFRTWFEEEYEAVRKDGRFSLLDMPPVDRVHNSYFAVSSRGMAKDSREGRDTQADTEAYELIMRDKQRLMSFDEPLRFIFSHSALAEGWDNPNVFTICNLQDGKSEMRKRQQIGRGLRLPVMSNGERCRVDEVNNLTIIANEAFEKFASALQKEIEEETGVSFEGRVVNKRTRVELRVREDVLEDPLFKELWKRISPRTRYRLDFETDALIDEAVRRIKEEMPAVQPIEFRVSKTGLDMGAGGIRGSTAIDRGTEEVELERRVPDVLKELSRRIPVSRATIAEILERSGRLNEVLINPSAFFDSVTQAVLGALYSQLTDTIVYEPVDGLRWEARLFIDHTGRAYEANVVPATKSITNVVPVDSQVERDFVKDVEDRDDVKLYVKLPSWFKVPTPLGGYNPDWAVVLETEEGECLYLVRETKGGKDVEKLRFEHEQLKIKFGEKHFDAIRVDYRFGKVARELLKPSERYKAKLSDVSPL